jgi:RimJ/RimL family protein N-acetyltransferase
MAHPYWPLFDLRVRTPQLELRGVDEELTLALAELAAEGIHDPETMPFAMPWTDVAPPQLQRQALQHYWRGRGEWTPEKWHLALAVLRDGELVGVQGVRADNFAVLRWVETGSWVGRAFQRQGIGKEMRAAVLHLAFAGLGAQVAYSGAWHDNQASLAVSRALGYEENGDNIELRRDQPDRMVKFKLARHVWETRRRDDVVIEHLAPCLELFGIAS